MQTPWSSVAFPLRCHCMDFLCQFEALSQLIIEQKLSKMVKYISNLQFDETYVKTRPKIGKLQMFKFTTLKFKALHWFCYLVWRSCSFRQNKYTRILMVQMLFSQIQQAPDQNFGKVGKSLHCVFSTPSAQCGRRENALRAP